jgi:hypothetical protein
MDNPDVRTEMTTRTLILTTPDLGDSRHRPLIATITFDKDTATIIQSDAYGRSSEPLTVPAELAEPIARRMLGSAAARRSP